MTGIHLPTDEMHIAAREGILDGEGMDYFVHDGGYRAATAHSFIDGIRTCAEFMVPVWLVPERPDRHHAPGETVRNIIITVPAAATRTGAYGLPDGATAGVF